MYEHFSPFFVILVVFYQVFFFFDGTRVWTQGFVLAKQALYHVSYASSPFYSGYFGDRVLQTICPGWPQTMILTISASQIARITCMSYSLFQIS
jgi:hypothetical protein